MDSQLTLLAAFAAGVGSFLLPCTLALVPVFLAHLAGITFSSLDQLGRGGNRVRLFFHTVAFVLGFTLVFVLLGASLGVLSQVASESQLWLARIGGVVIIYFGLATLELVPNPFVFTQRLSSGFSMRPQLGYAGSFMVGTGIGVGFTPCVGPILGSVLVLAGTSGSAVQGSFLLLAYSLGMMVPFLAFSIFTGGLSGFVRSHKRWVRVSSYGSGALLILLGVVVFTNNMRELVGYFFLRPF